MTARQAITSEAQAREIILWNSERHIDRSELASSGEILRSVGNTALDAEEYGRERAEC